jgi:hypothetical protein
MRGVHFSLQPLSFNTSYGHLAVSTLLIILSQVSNKNGLFCRLNKFLDKAKCVLDYFQPYLGRIEIMGSAGRIERVYFEIKQSNIDQWEKPQIKVSIK